MTKDERFFITTHTGRKIMFRNIVRIKFRRIEPMIQVEIERAHDQKPLIFIRCDYKEDIGFHLDIYNINGTKSISHQRLESQNCKDAIVEVINMLKKDLEQLLVENGFDSMLGELPDNWKDSLEDAKEFLLEQADHPEIILGMSGTTTIGSSFNVVFIDNRQRVHLTEVDEKCH